MLRITLVFTVILSLGAESVAEAGFLKNGVRPGGGSFQTAKPPASGARDRIKAPGERRRVSGPRSRSRSQQHSWFWTVHAPGLSAASSTRWDAAIRTMATRRAGGEGISRRETLSAIQVAFNRQIGEASARHRISEVLLAAVISVESAGKPKALSPKGAQGLMQLIPATAKRFGVSDPFDTSQNINGGAAYLSWLLDEFRGDPLLALAGYNAGEGAVRKHKGVPPYAETRDYVVKVMDAVAALRVSCAVPPASPRSHCEWTGELG